MGILQSRRSVTGIIVGLLAICLLAGLLIVNGKSWSSNHEGMTTEAPKFSALLPASSTIEKFGGWKKYTPPQGSDFYVFSDNINGTAINVSQQELPEQFEKNPDGNVSSLAKNYNANRSFKAGDTTVYIGASAKGPQSVIFHKDGLLVLIKSQDVIQDESWINYIEKLSLN